MNHLKSLATEWLDYNGYFVRTGVRVGKRPKGGWSGELDVVALHPERRHFLHVECSSDAWTWGHREAVFKRKFEIGGTHGRELFSGLDLPAALDQVVLHGFAGAPERHRDLGGGRLVTAQELVAEILGALPPSAKSAVPEKYPLLRTLQIVKMAGAAINGSPAPLIPSRT